MFSCEICEFFLNTYFEKHLQTAASLILSYPQCALGCFILTGYFN